VNKTAQLNHCNFEIKCPKLIFNIWNRNLSIFIVKHFLVGFSGDSVYLVVCSMGSAVIVTPKR